MPLSLVPSFLFYCFITGITPGPANLTSLHASMVYGRRAALRQWWGLVTGAFADALFAVLINIFLGSQLGDKVKYLSYVGAAYILWLAFHVLLAKAPGEDGASEKSCSFLTGLLCQLTNVKVILFCITVLSTYVVPYTESPWAILGVGMVLPFTGPLCNMVWLLAGAKLQGLFRTHRRLINTLMFLSLLFCVWEILK